MKKPTVSEIFGYTKRREIFDFLGHEFSYSPVEKKIVLLKRLNEHGLLEEAIMEYKKLYSAPYKKYLIDDLPKTLLCYIGYLETGEMLQTRFKENLTEEQIVGKLKELLNEKPD